MPRPLEIPIPPFRFCVAPLNAMTLASPGPTPPMTTFASVTVAAPDLNADPAVSQIERTGRVRADEVALDRVSRSLHQDPPVEIGAGEDVSFPGAAAADEAFVPSSESP